MQDAVETLLVGRGLKKGEEYDREVGRVKVSIREAVPDFIFHRLGLALEIKLAGPKTRAQSLVDQIQADIGNYSHKYARLIFVVYDMGKIRDSDEFCRDLEKQAGVRVTVVKH